jgi:signal transduction histidine kinase
MTPLAGRPRTLAGSTLKSVDALLRVLVGRDEAPAWRSAARRRSAYAVAAVGWVLLAGSAIAVATLAALRHPPSPNGSAAPGALGWLAVELAVSAVLLLAPRYPLLAWRLAYLGAVFAPLIPGQNRVDTGLYVLLTITFVVASLRNGLRPSLVMAALMLLPVWLWTGPDWVYPIRLTVGLVILTAALYAVGRWSGDRRALAAQTRQTTQQRERNAVLEERARIAREMHDVVAHRMSMIAVQAETAPYRITGLPGNAQAEFAALSQSAREALTEMRGLLGVLRSADGEAELVPQPQLGDVPELVAAARRAGAEVTLAMPDNSKRLPATVGLTAYRIVQESLSNAGRHAPGARISVVVREEPRYVRIDIKNEPPAAGQRRTDGTGHGLAGMRERVALIGGQLHAGPEADGGFAVRAVLPAGGRP